jgi:hypothetical protein
VVQRRTPANMNRIESMGEKAARRRTGLSYAELTTREDYSCRYGTHREAFSSRRDFVSGLLMILIDSSVPGGVRGSGCPE